MDAGFLRLGNSVLGVFSVACTILPVYYFVDGQVGRVANQEAQQSEITQAYASLTILQSAIARGADLAALGSPAAPPAAALENASAASLAAERAWRAGDYDAVGREAARGLAIVAGDGDAAALDAAPRPGTGGAAQPLLIPAVAASTALGLLGLGVRWAVAPAARQA